MQEYWTIEHRWRGCVRFSSKDGVQMASPSGPSREDRFEPVRIQHSVRGDVVRRTMNTVLVCDGGISDHRGGHTLEAD